jgi:DNA polymerase-1
LKDKELIFHNARFDLQILQENGYVHEGIIWDTMIMAHLANENHLSYELDMLSLFILKERKKDLKLIEKIFGWNNIPVDIMGDYAEQDVALTYKLFTRFYADLDKLNLLGLWPDCAEYIKSLQKMCDVGIDVDWKLLKQLSKEAQARMLEIAQELQFYPTGLNRLKKFLLEDIGVKPIYKVDKKTKKPSITISTDDAAIRAYYEQIPDERLNLVLEYRKLSKADSTWYQGFAKRRGPNNVLHPGLKQHGTRTGRLSCAEPNLQQMPRDSSRVKRLFIDKPGYKLVEVDFSQIELRVGSVYAKQYGDPLMFNTYVEGADVHDLTARLVGAYERMDNQYEARQCGKQGNFLWIYGGQGGRLQRTMWEGYKIRVSLEDCNAWTDMFHQKYPGFSVAAAKAKYLAESRGYVKYWNGRRRNLHVSEARLAFNSIIQGGCGQILMLAINELYKHNLRSLFCNTVHDSIWAYIPVNSLDEEIERICSILSSIPEKVFGLPFPVDYKIWNAHSGNE